MRTDWDVTIVGGGPAGLSAALILGRCRRRTLVCDSGTPRSWASTESRGFFTRDRIDPRELRRLGRDELARYPNVTIRGCEFNDNGGVCVGRYEATSVPGVYVAGNAVKDVHLVVVVAAAAEGAKAAMGINKALTREDFAARAARRRQR